MVKTPRQEAQIQSLVGELRSHLPHIAAKKKKKNTEITSQMQVYSPSRKVFRTVYLSDEWASLEQTTKDSLRCSLRESREEEEGPSMGQGGIQESSGQRSDSGRME